MSGNECDSVWWHGLCMTDVWQGLKAASSVWVCGAWEMSYDAMMTFSPLSRISDPVVDCWSCGKAMGVGNGIQASSPGHMTQARVRFGTHKEKSSSPVIKIIRPGSLLW